MFYRLHGGHMCLQLPVIASSKVDADSFGQVHRQQQWNKKHYNQELAAQSHKISADYVHIRKPGWPYA